MATLDDLIREAQKLLSPRMTRTINREAGREVARLIERGFDLERDPYGVPWKPSQRAIQGKGKTLTKTWALRTGIDYQVDAMGVVFRIRGKANKYAAIHQYGGTIQRTHHDNGRFRSAQSQRRLKNKVATASTGRIPARPFMPDVRGRNLPPDYQRAVANVANTWLRVNFRGAR